MEISAFQNKEKPVVSSLSEKENKKGDITDSSDDMTAVDNFDDTAVDKGCQGSLN